MPPAPVSVVIPVLNAGAHLPALISSLFGQAPRRPAEIILVDSGSTDGAERRAAERGGIRVVRIGTFTHGGARNLGLREARSGIVAFLSQDALPCDERWMERLTAPLTDERVAAVFSRQVPREDASPMERFFLASHFPPGEGEFLKRRGEEPLSFQRGIFFSNVSSALKRDLGLKFPFREDLVMSEDQQFARDVIYAGFEIRYEPSSAVYHSHNYTLATVFRRYFDSAWSLDQIFPEHTLDSSLRIGGRYIGREAAHIAARHPLLLPYYSLYTAARGLGTLFGHHAGRLPRGLARRMSLHPAYWR